jgi:hypothetical protein
LSKLLKLSKPLKLSRLLKLSQLLKLLLKALISALKNASSSIAK